MTAARDLQNFLDIEMCFQMIGECVQCRFYAGLIGQRRCDTEMSKPRFSKGVAGKQAMDIGSLHSAVSRTGAIGPALDIKQRPRAVATFAAAKMNLIAPDRRAGRAMPSGDERRGFV